MASAVLFSVCTVLEDRLIKKNDPGESSAIFCKVVKKSRIYHSPIKVSIFSSLNNPFMSCLLSFSQKFSWNLIWPEHFAFSSKKRRHFPGKRSELSWKESYFSLLICSVQQAAFFSMESPALFGFHGYTPEGFEEMGQFPLLLGFN